jgi:hypothetical protein
MPMQLPALTMSRAKYEPTAVRLQRRLLYDKSIASRKPLGFLEDRLMRSQSSRGQVI